MELSKRQNQVINWLNGIGSNYGKMYGDEFIEYGYDDLNEMNDINMDLLGE